MKLTVFGRDPQQADVVLSSTFVSGYHAELIQLDNGDMYLVDKSSNGTLLNGSKLVPGKETPVRRGDNVMFADVPLNWNQIEDLRLPANVKVVKTIGAHYTNDIKLQGAAVSRFHAALRQTNDGKWYICDYSKNGTTVNGRRIEKNNYVPLNAGDAIACAGVAVENPVKKKGAGKIIGISLAVLAVCAAIVLVVVIKPWPWSADKVYKEYNPSVLFMACGYHFEVECGALDISQIDDPNSIGQKLYSSFVIDLCGHTTIKLTNILAPGNTINIAKTENIFFFEKSFRIKPIKKIPSAIAITNIKYNVNLSFFDLIYS